MSTPIRLFLFSTSLLVALTCLPRGPHASGTTRLKRVQTVVIDPGHGGDNLGAPSVAGGHEKTLTLAIAKKIERGLQRRTDSEVYLTRRDDRDLGLRERTRFANQVNADLFLSIHCNAAPHPRARGIEVYFLSAEASDEEAARLVEFENQRLERTAEPAAKDDREVSLLLKDLVLHSAVQDSAIFAGRLLDALVRRTGAPSRGVKQAPFEVLKEATMPAVVVEVGFISHPDEARELATPERQEDIAAAVVDAIISFDRTGRYR